MSRAVDFAPNAAAMPRIASVAFLGVEARAVDVQVYLAAGLPSFTIVGLPDKAVAESRERVRAALAALGLALPPKRITVNLAPADLPKEGSHYDLPIAIGLMTAMNVLPFDALASYLALGELGLDGSLAPVAGCLPAAIAAQTRSLGLICPAASGGEAAWSGLGEEKAILAPASLLQLVNHFKGTQILAPPEPARLPEPAADGNLMDIARVRGQETARRAVEIAAAGGHNLLMSGPPGAGKSLLAACLPSLLPPLSAEEALEAAMISSLAGDDAARPLARQRPFRAPHHSASMAAMIGGGPRAAPGEAVLAHSGVLFLDELPEFSRQVLDALRQPLEAGEVSIARARAHITYPARFQLVAAMNPCRCGYAGDAQRGCSRQPRCVRDYQSRLSGPFLDRIDLFVDMPAVEAKDLAGSKRSESSAVLAARIAVAREVQKARWQCVNARADPDTIAASASKPALAVLQQAAGQWRLTARSYHRSLRTARTIADLAGQESIAAEHMSEALAFRQQFIDLNQTPPKPPY